jgi:hypothetical protein
MKKQSLLNRAVKIAAVSMLTFGLFFNIGIELESGKFGIPILKSITFGSITFAMNSGESFAGGMEKAEGCTYTGDIDDFCFYKKYKIYNCKTKSVVVNESTCGFYPLPS